MSTELSDKVASFAALMQEELNNNAHKGNWEEFKNIEKILTELEWHKVKLLFALKEGDNNKIKEYLADCANNLLFIANALNIK